MSLILKPAENRETDRVEKQTIHDLLEHFAPWEKELYQRAVSHSTYCGTKTREKKFLAIGISTVYRKKNYIEKTIQSLITKSEVQEREDVILIIYLADTDQFKRYHN